jgi:type I restriction enzyme R subunit
VIPAGRFRHRALVIAASQLNHEIDLSTVDFDYIAQHQRDTTSGKLSGGVALEPAKESGTGTARDPELVALEEVIAQINDLFSGDHPDSSVRNVVTHIKDRLEESETLQQQAQNNTLAQFSARPGPAERICWRSDWSHGIPQRPVHAYPQRP